MGKQALKAAKTFVETAAPEPSTVKAPDISIVDAALSGNIKAVKQHIAAGTDEILMRRCSADAENGMLIKEP